MVKPTEMPLQLAKTQAAMDKLGEVRCEAVTFDTVFGPGIDDVNRIMESFGQFDDRTAAVLTLAVVMATPEDVG